MKVIERLKTIEELQSIYMWMLSDFIESTKENVLAYYERENGMLDFTMLFDDSLTIENIHSNVLNVISNIDNNYSDVIISVDEEDNPNLVKEAIKELYDKEMRDTIMHLIYLDVNKVIHVEFNEEFEQLVEDVQDDILISTKYNLVYDDIYPRIVNGVIERLG